MKKLKKKILQLEARIQKDAKKLSKLKAKLTTTGKAPPAPKKSTLTPEGRAKLSALMKAKWAEKKAAPVPNITTSV